MTLDPRFGFTNFRIGKITPEEHKELRMFITKLNETCDWLTMLLTAMETLGGRAFAIAVIIKNIRQTNPMGISASYFQNLAEGYDGDSRYIGEALIKDENCKIIRDRFANCPVPFMFFTEAQYRLIKAETMEHEGGSESSIQTKMLAKQVEVETFLKNLQSDLSKETAEGYKPIIDMLIKYTNIMKVKIESSSLN